MKFFFIFGFIFFHIAFANETSIIADIFKNNLITNYHFTKEDAATKLNAYSSAQDLIAVAEQKGQSFSILVNKYFNNSDEDFKQIDEKHHPLLKTIIIYCLYKSATNNEILKVCSSDTLIEKIDYLTEEKYSNHDSGTWSDMMSDLYEIAYLLQDNLDSITNLQKATPNMSNTEVQKETSSAKAKEEVQDTKAIMLK